MDKPPPPPRNGRRLSAVSLSPRKTRKALNPSEVLPVRRKTKIRRNFGVALSKNETVLVTGAGDVLVSRCRFSSKAYSKLKQANGKSEQGNDHSHELFWWEASDCHSVCVNPCSGSGSPQIEAEGGLLGGSPPQLDAVQVDSGPDNESNVLTNNSADTPEKDDDASATRPVDESKMEDQDDSVQIPASKTSESSQAASKDDDDEIDDLAGIPSFDYSHFVGEGNDMAPTPTNELAIIKEKEQKAQEKQQVLVEYRAEPPVLMHGVPTFLPAFHQIKITQVSANPLGSHVLLISEEALLFSFGLNNHGQLGHGYKSPEKGSSTGFVTTPSIVTPLLENGGKALVCSAGVDYSLVVVKTEDRRIGRLSQTGDRPVLHRRGASDSDLSVQNMTRVTSLPSRIQQENEEIEMQSSDESSEESLCHHQLYAFGRNDIRKLGLVDPSKRKAADDVLVPRRVALTCKVWPGSEDSKKGLPPPGIFAIAASARHSAALVRRASGAIETYTWGDATFDALGPVGDSPVKSPKKRRNRQVNGCFTPAPLAVPVPTVVKQLSHSASSTNDQDIIPIQVALGPTTTFVVTSTGKVLSFGKSDIGLLGQGHGVVMTNRLKPIVFPSAGSRAETKISSISVGPSHAVAVASSGRVYAWGKNEGGVMGFDSTLRKHLSRSARRATREKSHSDDEVEWIPREVEIPVCSHSVATNGRRSSSRDSESSIDPIGAPPLCSSGSKVKDRVLQACAGNDLTVFVKESGEVLSCGASSGRLGLGETGTTSVITPKPMFGGLRLWED